MTVISASKMTAGARGGSHLSQSVQGENPLPVSSKPGLAQKSLDHLHSQGQEVLSRS